jgi:hypothetical protein
MLCLLARLCVGFLCALEQAVDVNAVGIFFFELVVELGLGLT